MVDQIQEINKKPWLLVTQNGTEKEALPKDMTFNEGHVVSIISYSILVVLSGLANMTVLTILLKKRRHSRRTSMMNTMLINLAIADLLVTFLMMPLEIGWSITVSWKAGDAMCRIMAFFRIFGLFLSGFVLMCISIDRYYAVLKPLGLSQIKRRGTIMLTVAWMASFICSAPQLMIFHVERHPNFTFYEQCVTFNFFKSRYDELAYQYFGLVMMYGFPLSCIVFCYTSILRKIYNKYKKCNNGSDTMRRSSAGFLGRARIRTLQMTITIVMGFIVCWTPYYVMCLWYWMDQTSAEKVDQRIQKGLFFFASLNSMMNPIVYGIFNVRTSPPKSETHKSKPSSKQTMAAIPDVVNGSQEPKTTTTHTTLWKLHCHTSFSSQHNDDENTQTNPQSEKKKRFLWKFRTQRSYSSDGTELGGDAIPTVSAQVKRDRWRQRPQRSNLSDASQFHTSQDENTGWKSWMSHKGPQTK